MPQGAKDGVWSRRVSKIVHPPHLQDRAAGPVLSLSSSLPKFQDMYTLQFQSRAGLTSRPRYDALPTCHLPAGDVEAEIVHGDANLYLFCTLMRAGSGCVFKPLLR